MLHLIHEFVSVEHYKLANKLFQQTHEHKTIRVYDDDSLKSHWREEIMTAHLHEQNHHKFLNKLREFEDRWDHQLGRIPTSKHHFELASENIQPIHSTVSHTQTTASQFTANKIEQILEKHIIRPAAADENVS